VNCRWSLAYSWGREVDDLLSKEVRVTRFVLSNSKQCSCNVYPFWGGGLIRHVIGTLQTLCMIVPPPSYMVFVRGT
jgi:hypothetical protein